MWLKHTCTEEKLCRPHTRVKGVAILDAHRHIATLHRGRRDGGESSDVRIALCMALHRLHEPRRAVRGKRLEVLRRCEASGGAVAHDASAHTALLAARPTSAPTSTHNELCMCV